MKLAIAISILVVFIAGYNLWPYMTHSFFYQAMAVGILLCAYQLVKTEPKGTTVRRVYMVFFWLAISNLIDELFFDPTKFEFNEYLFAVLIIIHQVYLYQNARKSGKYKSLD